MQTSEHAKEMPVRGSCVRNTRVAEHVGEHRSEADNQHQNGDQNRSSMPVNGLHEIASDRTGVLDYPPVDRTDDRKVHAEIEHANQNNGGYHSDGDIAM